MNFVRNQWFLISLVICLVFGFLFAHPLKFLSDLAWLKWAIVTTTLFFMAWPLEASAVKRAFLRPLAPAIGMFVSFVFIPAIAIPMAPILGPFLGPGLIAAAAAPSTLATSAVWTRRAGGDDAVALMITLVTNGTCFLITPIWVYLGTGNSFPEGLLQDTVVKLLLFVVAPMVLAKALRLHLRSANWATDNKSFLSVLAQIGVLLMTILGAVKTGLKMAESNVALFSVPELVLTLVVVTFVHLIGLAVAMWIAFGFGLPARERIAVGIGGSQKTMMVGLTTAINLGFSIIPMVAYHTIQLIVDTLIVDRYRDKIRAEDESGEAKSCDFNGD